jgi:eukaryotic-like serine/threonine-protein kinase
LGYLLVSSGTDGSIRFWNAQTGKLLEVQHIHNAGVGELAILPDDRYLASASEDGTFDVWGIQPEMSYTLNPSCLRVFAPSW